MAETIYHFFNAGKTMSNVPRFGQWGLRIRAGIVVDII
jgi:hypothetical protein